MNNKQRPSVVMLLIMLFLLFSAPLAAQRGERFVELFALVNPNFNKTFVPDTIGPGSVSTLRFDITNDHFDPVADLAFIDNLPVGVFIADPARAFSNCGTGSLTVSQGGTIVNFSGGSVGGFQSCSVWVDVTSSVVGTHNNVSGDLTSGQLNFGAATDDLIVALDRPGFSKSFSPASIDSGERSTLTFTIDNTANTSQALSLNFVDNLPSPMIVANPANASTTCVGGQITANPGSSMVSYSSNPVNASVPAAASCNLNVDVTAANKGVLENISDELTSLNSQFSTVSSGKASASLDVSVSTVHLVKTFIDDPVSPGDTVIMEFNIFNRSRSEVATNIEFSDDLDGTLTGLVATGLPQSNMCGTSSILDGTSNLNFSGGSLEPEESCTFSISLLVPANAVSGGYFNETTAVMADLAGQPFDGNTASDILFVDNVPVLTKEFLSNLVGGSETITMQFTINSDAAAEDIAFEDNLTAFIEGIPFSSVILPADNFCGTGSTMIKTIGALDTLVLQMSGGSLAAGDYCTFTVDLTLPGSAPGGLATNTTSEILATINGVTKIGNPASASLTVVTTPTLTKEFIDDPVQPGGTVTLLFTLTYPAEAAADATSITFSDDLESTGITGLVAIGLPQSDVCGVGSEVSGTTVITLTGGTLMPADACEFQVTVQVPATTLPGSYTNTTDPLTAVVGGVATTGGAINADLQIAGLELSKSFTDDPVIPGDTVTLEFTLTNSSPTLDATDIVFVDNLNSVLSGLTAITFSAVEPCGPGSIINGTSTLVFAGGSLLAGSSCTFSATLQVPGDTANDTYKNSTSALQANMGGNSLSLAPAVDDLIVSDQLLIFSKSFDQDSVAAGGSVDLTFNITNSSITDTVTAIAFTDDLDAALSGLVAIGLPTTGDCGAGSSLTGTDIITLTGAELLAGESCQFSVTLAVPITAGFGVLVNNLTSPVTGLVGELAVSGDPASASFKVRSVEFSKVFSSGDVFPGDTTTLSFTITNFSDETVDRMFFTDDLEATLSGLVATSLPLTDMCGNGSVITGTSVLTFNAGVLAAGEFCSFDVSLLVPGGALPGSYLNLTSDLTVAGGEIVSQPASATLVISEQESPPRRVLVCHKPGTKAEKTLEIDINALGGHLGHGDFIGQCP